jgi:hypothetical protein
LLQHAHQRRGVRPGSKRSPSHRMHSIQ